MTTFDDTHFRDQPNAEAPPPTETFVNGLALQTSDERELKLLESKRMEMCRDLAFLGEASRNKNERNFSAEFVTACHVGTLDGNRLLNKKPKLSVQLSSRVAYVSTLHNPSELPPEVVDFLSSEYCRSEPTIKGFATNLLRTVVMIFIAHEIEVGPISFSGFHFTRDLAFLLEASPLAFEQARSVDYLLTRDFKMQLKTDLLRDVEANSLNRYLSLRLDYLRIGRASGARAHLQ
jgi:hypothetical protein